MPIKVVLRRGKYCLIEPSGETLGCHDTRKLAEGQRRAIGANKGFKNCQVFTAKESGLRYMLLVSSNAYQDLERDIIKQKTLEKYAKEYSGKLNNSLLFWHKGAPIGDIIHAEMHGAFLIEIAKELPDKLVNLTTNLANKSRGKMRIKHVWDYVESHPGKWGVSIGFYVLERSKHTISEIHKRESSLLWRGYEANPYTLGGVLT